MRLHTLLLLFLFGSFQIHAQRQQKIDSLKALYETSENIDKFHVLNNLWMESINYNIEESDQYANEMIALGIELALDSIIRFGYERKGVGFAYRNVFDSSAIYFRKALKMYRDIGDSKGAGSILRNMGQDLHIMGNLDSAYYYYDAAGQNFEQANDSSGIASIYNSKAVLYANKGYFNLALEEALKSDRILERLQETPELEQNYMVIATAYSEMKDTANALEYYNRLTDFFRENGLQRQLCSNLVLSTGLQIPNQARKNDTESEIKEAISIAESLQSIELKNNARLVYANFYYQYGAYQQSISLLTELIDEKGNQGEDNVNSGVYISLGKSLIALGDYSDAVKYLTKANEMANQDGYLKENAESNRWLSLAYQKQNENAQALAHYKTYKALNDSLYNSESQNRFNELQTIYETEKKEAQLAMQAREIENLNIQAENDQLTKTLYGIGMFSFLAIAGLLYFGFTQRLKKNAAERQKQEEIYKKELAFKKKELASQTLHLVQKSSFIAELKENLERIKQSPDLFKVEFRRLVMLLKKESAEDKEWEIFKSYFSEVHNDFDKSLKAVYHDITEKEIRLAAYLRMNLTTKEIASLLNVLPDSVLKSKYRLKKKLNLEKDQDLNAYLNTL
jgi:tetratricopeptide (TPR) repeat protein/DNA-binding CsgD family transcriptional regulator